MKMAMKPEGAVEHLGAALGLMPLPMGDTWCAQKIARWIMAATKLGLFEALEKGPLTTAEIARKCQTHPGPTGKLLGILSTAGYVKHTKGSFALRPMARKWMLKSSPVSLYDNMLFQFFEWKLLDASEDFIRTGKPIDFHGQLSSDEWRVYQDGMRSVAGTNAAEIVKRTPVPKDATQLLDIGGSHGYYSVALCRKHPGLTATILDLPEAIAHSAAILAREEMGERVVHRPGNALTTDLGENQYDAVLISSLVHHFDDATNLALVKRIARALKPGGVLTIIDFVRLEDPERGGQVAWLMNLYFAMTSQSGAWSFEDMMGWQRAAGLVPRKPRWLQTLPGSGVQSASKAR